MLKTHRWYKAAKAVIGLGAAGLVVGLVALECEHHFSTTLPAPTGPYGVGRTHLTWTGARPNSPYASPSADDELAIWIWYPAASRPGPAQTTDYLPPKVCEAVMQARGVLMGHLLTRDLAKVRAHAMDDAPLAAEPKRFPVLLLRGGASAEVWNYTTLAEDLASHGYVVVGFDVPYRTNVVVRSNGIVARRAPENDVEAVGGREQDERVQRLLAAWTTDMSRMLDQLERMNAMPGGPLQGRVDMNRVGAFGHSFGGAQAARFCELDPRCRAGVDIDGGLFGGVADATLTTPFMFLLSDHRHERREEVNAIWQDIDAMYHRLPSDRRALVTIQGANHFAFSDDTAMLKSHLLIGALRLVGLVRIDGPRQLAITAQALRWFFDTHLRQIPTPPLTAKDFPELQFAK